MNKDSPQLELPYYKDCASIHYGCSKFGEGETVHWIGCVYWEDGEKKYFFADGGEESLIESFKDFLDKHTELTFLHWGMNSPQFGFSAIEKRYEHLTGKKILLYPKFAKDLSEYLKEKYGIEYVNREGGRLNNLAKLNGFSGYSESVEVKSKTEAAGRLELIFSIVQAESQGKLKIQSEATTSDVRQRKLNSNKSESSNGIDKLLTAKGVENWGLLIQILKDNDPPLLSKDGLWIGKPKNAVCLWFDLIRKGGFAKHPNSYKELADIFNGEFTGLDIESTMFGKGYPRAEKKFKKNLELRINQIPSNTR